MYDMEQIGLPGSENLLKQQLAESGLEMQWLGTALSVAGAAFGIAGAASKQSSNNKAIKIQHKANKEQWEYENESAERQVDFIREQNEVARLNNFRNAQFQDQTNLQNWKHTIDQQDFSYALDLRAKAESDKRYNAQLNQNRMALDGARNQQNYWLREQEMSRDFAIGDQNLILAGADSKMSAAFNEILMTLGRDADRVEGQIAGVQHKRKTELGITAFQSQDNMVKSLMAAGSAQNQQAGRSGGKAVQAAVAAGGRKEAQLTQQATDIYSIAAMSLDGLEKDLFWLNQDAARNREMVGQEYISAAMQVSYNKDKIQQTYRSALGQHELNMHDIHQNFQQANLNALAQNMLMPLPGPKPPPPFATPLPDILDPYDHVWSPKPRKGAAQTGGIMSAVGGAIPGIVSAYNFDFGKPKP